MATQTGRTMTIASLKNIMEKRALVTAAHVGKSVKLYISGDGNVVDVKDKAGNFVKSIISDDELFQKRIYNCRANSALAMQSPRNIAFFQAGVAAERSGAKVRFDAGAGEQEYSSHELLNLYLNKVQLSFNVPTTSAIIDQLGRGTEIKAEVIKVTTENGSLLTIDAATISVMKPLELGSTKFDISAFAPAEGAPADEKQPEGSGSPETTAAVTEDVQL